MNSGLEASSVSQPLGPILTFFFIPLECGGALEAVQEREESERFAESTLLLNVKFMSDKFTSFKMFRQLLYSQFQNTILLKSICQRR